MARSSTPNKAKTPGKEKPEIRFVQAEAQPPGLSITNSGKTTIEIVSRAAEVLQIKAGGKQLLTPQLLEVEGSGQSGAPMELASRSLLLAALTSKGGAGKVTLDASSLRGQGAVYGVPEILVLREKRGSCIPAARALVELEGDEEIAVLVIGRGPVINLGVAMRSLFALKPRTKQEPETTEQ